MHAQPVAGLPGSGSQSKFWWHIKIIMCFGDATNPTWLSDVNGGNYVSSL